MILVRDIRLPLDAPEDRSFARALRRFGKSPAQVRGIWGWQTFRGCPPRPAETGLYRGMTCGTRQQSRHMRQNAEVRVLHRPGELTLQPGQPLRCRPVV